MVTYGTTLHALQDHAALQSAETLLVLGAAGGVGLAAVELGKVFGARVVAAVSSAAKADVALQAGADHVVVYPRGPLSAEQARVLSKDLKEAVGRNGADVVYDPLGGLYAEPALRALAWEGRYLIIGFTAGIAALKANVLLLHAERACGVYWGDWTERDPASFRREIDQLLAWWSEGRIHPLVSDVLPFDRAAEGFRALADRRAVGKIVIRAA